jgi:hypothetical protein
MTTDFQKEIEDRNRSVVVDLPFPGEPLMIAFGGFAGRMSAIPPFEFFNLTHRMRVNKVYLRDLDQSWYHAGLRGKTRDIGDTAEYLKSLIGECGTKRLVMFGSSMGGYAALLFGALLDAHATHAFAPHTLLSDTKGVRHREELRGVQEAFPGDYFDLKKVLGSAVCSGDFHLYHDSTDRRDTRQANHLKELPNVYLHPFKGGGHNLIKYLKAAGELEKLVSSALDGIRFEPRRDIRLKRSLLDCVLGRKVG